MAARAYPAHIPRFVAICLCEYVPAIFVSKTSFLQIAGGVVVFGVGLELNEGMCSAGIYLCIACYATSKLLIYAFLSA